MTAIPLLAAAMRRYNEGDMSGASASFDGLISLAPERASHYFQAALIEHRRGNLESAISLYRRSLAIDPGPSAHVNLGLLLHLLSRFDEAELHAREALRVNPRCVEALTNLGNTLQQLRRLGEAETALREAIQIRPSETDAINNLGNVLLDMGRVDEAIECFDRAVSINGHRNADFNAVFARLYADTEPESIFKRSVEAAHRQLSAQSVFAHQFRDRDRPRLGFISGDFRRHPVGYSIIRTLEYLSAQGFDLACYITTPLADDITQRFADISKWTEAFGMDDAALAQRVHWDQIDILFDLSGYTAGNRLGVFAMRPAPIQATWFAYPATTGLSQMDYLIGEPTQLEGLDDFCSEKIARLPTMICFEPPDHEPLPDLPAIRSGCITFGSFNVLKKVTPDTVALWARVLHAVPGARLLMKTPALDCPVTRQRYSDMFAGHGIDGDRLTMLGYTDSAGHRAAMLGCDIALDTFPYSGGVTTLECLWMGLPVITMPGNTYASRHSAHYLSTIGLVGLICDDQREYIDIAVFLSERLPMLGKLRENMRDAMLSSPICDIERHGKEFSAMLMEMWVGDA